MISPGRKFTRKSLQKTRTSRLQFHIILSLVVVAGIIVCCKSVQAGDQKNKGNRDQIQGTPTRVFQYTPWNVRAKVRKRTESGTKQLFIIAKSNFPEGTRLLLQLNRRGEEIPNLSTGVTVKEGGVVTAGIPYTRTIPPALYLIDVIYSPLRQKPVENGSANLQKRFHITVPIISSLFSNDEIHTERSERLKWFQTAVNEIEQLLSLFYSTVKNGIKSYKAQQTKFKKDPSQLLKSLRSQHDVIEKRKNSLHDRRETSITPVFPEYFSEIRTLLIRVSRQFEIIRNLFQNPDKRSFFGKPEKLQIRLNKQLQPFHKKIAQLQSDLLREKKWKVKDQLLERILGIKQLLKRWTYVLQNTNTNPKSKEGKIQRKFLSSLEKWRDEYQVWTREKNLEKPFGIALKKYKKLLSSLTEAINTSLSNQNKNQEARKKQFFQVILPKSLDVLRKIEKQIGFRRVVNRFEQSEK